MVHQPRKVRPKSRKGERPLVKTRLVKQMHVLHLLLYHLLLPSGNQIAIAGQLFHKKVVLQILLLPSSTTQCCLDLVSGPITRHRAAICPYLSTFLQENCPSFVVHIA